jgi:hypothetical protein
MLLGMEDSSRRQFQDLESCARILFDDLELIRVCEYQIEEPMVNLVMATIFRHIDNSDDVDKLARVIVGDNELLRAEVDAALQEDSLFRESKPEFKEAVKNHAPEVIEDYFQINRVKQHMEHEAVLVLSSNASLNRAFLSLQRQVSPDFMLIILSMAGLRVALPKIKVRDDDSLAEFKEKYESERQAYIDSFRGFLAECKGRLETGAYRDAWEYAAWNTDQDVHKQLHQLETAVAKTETKVLKKMGISLLQSAPKIIRSAGNLRFGDTAEAILEVLWKGLGILDERAEFLKNNPSLSYLYHLQVNEP